MTQFLRNKSLVIFSFCKIAFLGSLLAMRDPENALRAFYQAIRLSPDDPTVLLNAISCLINCGMQKEAMEHWDHFKNLQASGKITTLNEEVN